MYIHISDLRKIKGIGSKIINRILEFLHKKDGYVSEYNPEIHLDKNKIHHGDCLELMNGIPDKSIDMIMADLPYETINADWDSVIDINKLWLQYERIIKDEGAIVLTADIKFASELIQSNPELFRYDLIWEKTQPTGHLNSGKMPLRAHESVLVFYKNLPTYNPQKTKGHRPAHKAIKKATVHNKTEVYGKVNKTVHYKGGNTDRLPRSVLKFKSDKQKLCLHSTQKPVALIDYFIKTYSNKGYVVLDNASGSGTTGISAEKNGREFICIEKKEKHYNDSVERLKNARKTGEYL